MKVDLPQPGVPTIAMENSLGYGCNASIKVDAIYASGTYFELGSVDE